MAYDPDLESIVRELNEKAQPAREAGQPASQEDALSAPARRAASASLDRLLAYAVERGATDIVLVDGCGPVLRIHGSLTENKSHALAEEDIRALLLPLLTPFLREELKRNKSVDFSFVREGLGRFRTNIHFQRGGMAASIRLLPAEVPTLESLNLPPALARLAEHKQGFILVTGPTGSGKTTTLAALLGLINRKHACHVVTIEDPIEYHHANQKAVFEQIEVGHDARSFASALRSVLRQNPDVILVGEMRDPETTAAALTAAETGHLVFATLHTPDTVGAIGRIVDAFPAGQQNQVRQQLSLALAAIVAQQLVPDPAGKRRYPAVELLLANTAIRHLIRRGEDHMLRSQLTMGRSEGMMLMEESLAQLVQQGQISRETAAAYCFRPDELQRFVSF